MANVFAGYKGLAELESVGQFRFADASIAATQEVNAPDLIMGDWDHDAYNYGPITVGGSISGPVTETFVEGTGSGGLWEWGVQRTGGCGLLSQQNMELWYYCGVPENGGGSLNNRTFTDMTVNNLGLSCTAGDVAQFTIDALGTFAGPWATATTPDYTRAEKLITWDKISVSLAASTHDQAAGLISPTLINYQSFDFTVGNNLETVYSLSQANLFPFDIVPGIRTITGTLTAYNIPEAFGADEWDDYLASDVSILTFTLEGSPGNVLTINMNVQLHRVQPTSSPGLITSTIGFTGVTHQTGDAWVG